MCLTRAQSDHHPLFLQTEGGYIQAINSPFMYLDAWALDGRYKKYIQYSWSNSNEDLWLALQNTRCKSLEFNKKVLGNIMRRKRTLERRLNGIQRELQLSYSHSLMQLEMSLRKELETVLAEGENFGLKNLGLIG